MEVSVTVDDPWTAESAFVGMAVLTVLTCSALPEPPL